MILSSFLTILGCSGATTSENNNNEEQNPYWTDFVKEAEDSLTKQKEIEEDENQSFDEFLEDYYLGKS